MGLLSGLIMEKVYEHDRKNPEGKIKRSMEK